MTAQHADPQHNQVHQQTWELLPWYVNGTVDGLEHEAVEVHLSTCMVCQAELARCRDVAETVQKAEDLSWVPSSAHLSRIMHRIDTAEAQPSRAGDWWQRWRAHCLGYRTMLQATSPFIRWGLAAQGALILLLVSVMAWQGLFSSETLYRTLSDAGHQASPVHGQIRVVFTNDMTEHELRTLLADIGGTISKQPSAVGVHTVAIDGAAGSPERVGAVLATLRAHPKVLLAEPIVTQ
jgi:Putative zinc-finger